MNLLVGDNVEAGVASARGGVGERVVGEGPGVIERLNEVCRLNLPRREKNHEVGGKARRGRCDLQVGGLKKRMVDSAPKDENDAKVAPRGGVREHAGGRGAVTQGIGWGRLRGSLRFSVRQGHKAVGGGGE